MSWPALSDVPDNVVDLQERKFQRAEVAFKFLWHKKYTLLGPADGLTYSAYRVGNYCYDISKAGGEEIFASRVTIRTTLNLGVNTVDRAFSQLEELGWLLLEERGGKGVGKTGLNNKYRLAIPPRHQI